MKRKLLIIFLIFLLVCTGCSLWPSSDYLAYQDIEEIRDISNATILTIADQKYTGSAIEPTIIVTIDGHSLYKGTDYEVSYINNVAVGEATVVINGLGAFTGSNQKTFKIVKSNPEAIITCLNVKYNGKSQAIATCSGGTINNEMHTDAGTYVLSCKGDENHTNAKSKSCSIGKADISSAKIAELADEQYTGKIITPSVEVILNEIKLDNNKDFSMTYIDNIESNKAAIEIEGKGNYTGKQIIYFSIVKNDNGKGKAKITCLDNEYNTDRQIIATCQGGTVASQIHEDVGTYKITCTGDATHNDADSKECSIKKGNIKNVTVEQIPEMIYTGDEIKPNPFIYMNGSTLTKDKDYTFSYSNNISVGTATLTIIGKGKFTGTKTVSFKIAPDTRYEVKVLP